MSALFISTATAFGKGSDFYSMSKTLFKKKNNEYDKKSAYPMSCPQYSVGAGVRFDTGKGRDSGAAGQICNTSKTYKKLILIHVSGTGQICNTGKTYKKADKNTCFRDWADL